MLIMRCMSRWPSGIPADNVFQRAEILLQLFLQLKRPRAHTEDGVGQCRHRYHWCNIHQTHPR